MVFQEEGAGIFGSLWPLSRSLGADKQPGSGNSSEDDSSIKDRERAFDIADAMEMGLARELVTDFILPLRRSGKLWKFKVQRSADRLEYRLCGDDGAFLMYARAKQDAQLVEFFLYDPRDAGGLFDPQRPAFIMSRNACKTEWKITQEGQDTCQENLPAAFQPGQKGRREVLTIQHKRRNIGNGVNYVMEVTLPTIGQETPTKLVTRAPEWNSEVGSLVLDFKGRSVSASAKNFQLSPEDRPSHVSCQFGKLAGNTFGLDFRYPLTVIQAFGISMSTVLWT